MNRKEAGKLGFEKSKDKIKQYQDGLKQKYNESPKKCLYCNEVIPYIKRSNNFCDHSCSAKLRNQGVRRHGNQQENENCLYCNSKLSKVTGQKKYCTVNCQTQYEYEQYIIRWKLGEESGISGKLGTSSYIRRYLFEKYNNCCSECGWSKVHPITNKIPLQVEHVDGNWKNNREDNLKLLCGCCHSLTETYGALNKGNGRENRRN